MSVLALVCRTIGAHNEKKLNYHDRGFCIFVTWTIVSYFQTNREFNDFFESREDFRWAKSIAYKSINFCTQNWEDSKSEPSATEETFLSHNLKTGKTMSLADSTISNCEEFEDLHT